MWLWLHSCVQTTLLSFCSHQSCRASWARTLRIRTLNIHHNRGRTKQARVLPTQNFGSGIFSKVKPKYSIPNLTAISIANPTEKSVPHDSILEPVYAFFNYSRQYSVVIQNMGFEIRVTLFPVPSIATCWSLFPHFTVDSTLLRPELLWGLNEILYART